ncbi:MAG: glycosyltransferase family 4 protein [Actinobacteria bacterium]|nr:glycosyltransferase family 4 protein [Actinomycetota bacterium]
MNRPREIHQALNPGLLRVAFLNWRDTRNPEGGGSEVFVETIAEGLVARGHEVTLVCAEHTDSPSREIRRGVRIVRNGGKLDVYPRAAWALRSGSLGPLDVVVDVQNGLPFCSAVASKVPTVVLVHHVHREQWPVVYGPARSRIGWWLESKFAPYIYRRSSYVAVSHRTRDELVDLGVSAARISVVHNGTQPPPMTQHVSSPHPHIIVLGRLVPHKRVEHVLESARILREQHPGLRLSIVGDGWWREKLEIAAQSAGVSDITTFYGHVDESTKDRLLREAWVLGVPSLKEGWGLVIMEAAARGVPAVAYAEAGGVVESIADGRTGVIAHDFIDFTTALDRILSEKEFRLSLGATAAQRSAEFTWDSAIKSFEQVLLDAVKRS